jgi:protein-S-isoprenylcysteine O-methyltransferase Ste14
MVPLRLYLLTGLIVHKIVWEVLKARGRTASPPDASPWSRFVKSVKLLVLFGLIAQTMLPEVLPITETGIIPYVIGVPIYTIGLVLALLGRVQLGDNWLDIEHARVAGNQVLVSSGIYRYVRHPIYAGDLLLLVGLELALNSWLVVATAALTPIVYRQAVREEAMLASSFASYQTYARRTKRFVPFLV